MRDLQNGRHRNASAKPKEIRDATPSFVLISQAVRRRLYHIDQFSFRASYSIADVGDGLWYPEREARGGRGPSSDLLRSSQKRFASRGQSRLSVSRASSIQE